MSGLPTPRLRICNNPTCLNEFVSASRQAFYCPDCHRDRRNAAKRERERKQREENPEIFRERRRRYVAANHDKVVESDHRYYETHKEEKNARSRRWQKENPEAHREHARRWKAKRKAQRLAENSTIKPVPKTPQKKNLTQVSRQTLNEILSVQIQANLKKWEANGEMHYCERMRLKAKSLPCGTRDECYAGKKCPHAPELTTRARKRYIDLFV